MPDKPYKFLDYYTLDDAGIFFGRERETMILSSDVLVNRLVVLFARTGTGKTSIINAGVRPRLEAQGYKTFFIRVNEDPAESARAELARDPELRLPEGAPLARQLEDVVARLRRPIVLFFDQFEEFFIYVYNRDREKGREFIADVAALYHNERSGVHLLFSMREEFFVDMDAFRDEIPTIFHNDSNLRLRRFDKTQARDAIVYPARTFKVRMDADLVDRLLADLLESSAGDERHPSEEGLIEPAQLQIVCDTLWAASERRRAREGRIALEDYRESSGGWGEQNVAWRILYRRFGEGFARIESPADLDLLARLLPHLRTKERTKYVRDVEGLARDLGTDESALQRLLGRLESLRFIRRGKRDGVEVVELSHDYLVERLDSLAERVRAIWPRRTLELTFAQYRKDGAFASPDELNVILSQNVNLDLSPEESDFLFRSALAQGSPYLPAVFESASGNGVGVWQILRDVVYQRSLPGAVNALGLCRALASQLRGNEPDAARVTDQIFDLLGAALNRPDLTSKAQETLADLVSLQSPVVSAPATSMLLEHLDRVVEKGRVASGALGALGRVETPASVELLAKAVRRPDLTLEAQDALSQLAVAQAAEVAADAARELLAFYGETLPAGRMSPVAVGRLSSVETVESVRILRRALELEDVTGEAKVALDTMSGSWNTSVAEAARRAVSDFFSTGRPTPTGKRAVPTVHTDLGPVPEALMEDLAAQVRQGNCVLFVGPGVHAPPPPGRAFKDAAEYRVPLGADVARYLAGKSRYAERFPGEDEDNLSRVAQHFELRFTRTALVQNLRNMLREVRQPSPSLRALARLPFSVIVTTNYDSLLEQALRDEGKNPRLSIYSPDATRKTQKFDASPAEPLVLKLFGDLDSPQTMVITEEDFIHFFLRMSDKGPANPVPVVVRHSLSAGASLLIGYSLKDFNLRLILRSLLWNLDRSTRPPTYVVDPYPDPLLLEVWGLHLRLATFIAIDGWGFVEELHRGVLGREM